MKFSKETILGFSMGIAFCIVVAVIFAAKGSFLATTISIPQVLSYQGYLTDTNGVPITGTQELTFTLYDKDGTPVWDETQDVTFDYGHFSVYLGQQNPIAVDVLSNPPISLGIQVDGGDELPHQQLASVAYAMAAVKANDAETLGGKTEDTLDVGKVGGYDASYLLNRTNHIGTQAPNSIEPQGPGSDLDADLLDNQHGQFYLNRANHTGTQPPSTISPQGSGSGLDADMVDGKHATELPADGSVSQTKLKTAIGEVGSPGEKVWSVLTLPGGEYGFYPQVRMHEHDRMTQPWGARILGDGSTKFEGWTSYRTVIELHGGEDALFMLAQQRYITASGLDPWLFLLVDSTTGALLSIWYATDHPCYGNGEDENALPHPFVGNLTGKEVVLVELEQTKELVKECYGKTDSPWNEVINAIYAGDKPIKSIVETVVEEYRVDMSKAFGYTKRDFANFRGEHRFIDVLPDYIKVRKLISLTETARTQVVKSP